MFWGNLVYREESIALANAATVGKSKILIYRDVCEKGIRNMREKWNK
jgi:hypothetical protein